MMVIVNIAAEKPILAKAFDSCSTMSCVSFYYMHKLSLATLCHQCMVYTSLLLRNTKCFDDNHDKQYSNFGLSNQ